MIKITYKFYRPDEELPDTSIQSILIVIRNRMFVGYYRPDDYGKGGAWFEYNSENIFDKPDYWAYISSLP